MYVIQKSNLVKHCVTGSLFILLISGCTLSMPQAESSYRFVKNIISSEDVSTQEQQAIWLASVGDYGAALSPYLSGGLIIFANADGDAIAFDGWTIRSVVGFGLEDPLTIVGKDGDRIFSAVGQKTSTECKPWYLSGLTWHQTCANGDGEIALNPEGNIELISMSLGKNLGIVTLRVAK